MKKLFPKFYDSYCKTIYEKMHLNGKKMKVRKSAYLIIWNDQIPKFELN